MNRIRRFTKEDWYTWGGAEEFKNGTEPFIYEQELNNGKVDLTVIADKNGLQIIMTSTEEDDEEQLSWSKDASYTAIQAEGELRALVKIIQTYNYAPDLSYTIDHDREFMEFSWNE